MKDGSFGQEINGMEFDDEFANEEYQVKQIPIPSEMPKPIKHDDFSENVKRSSAVEALIQQNDDLMSRLSVSLRRIADLEENIQSQTLDNGRYKSRYENLKDQVLVLKEKAKILSERKGAEEGEVNGYKDQIKLLEIRYSELYENSQQKETRFLEAISKNNKLVARLTRYRRRVREAVLNMKETASTHRLENEKLNKRVLSQETTIADLRKNLLESTDYIRSSSKEQENELNRLVQKFENELEAKENTIQKLMADNQVLEARRDEFQEAQAKLTDVENDLVLKDRRFEEFRMQSATEMADLQKSLTRYRHESKEFALELESKKEELKETAQVMSEAREENFRLNEQVENLQSLWRDQQSKLEKTSAKNSSLQKLNQEMSMAINQYRRDIRELREQVDKDYIKSKDSSDTRDTEKKTNPELLEKIDRVLANMQIG